MLPVGPPAVYTALQTMFIRAASSIPPISGWPGLVKSRAMRPKRAQRAGRGYLGSAVFTEIRSSICLRSDGFISEYEFENNGHSDRNTVRTYKEKPQRKQ